MRLDGLDADAKKPGHFLVAVAFGNQSGLTKTVAAQLVSPLQDLLFFATVYPGRCPGLACCGPLPRAYSST